ncbi:MAG: flagellar basal body L-ring protein FlgH [Planctomycetaceae bacterium]|nr:flagellar basal body L-ring protein FlgH [Planctomycetaceae bacterium]
MKPLAIAALLLSSAAPCWAQSLLSGEGSPNDPPRKPSLRLHDHVQVQFAEPAKPAAESDRRVRWDKELRDWVRADAKDAAPATAMTAEVVDVRPNGVVVLQATKRRLLNKDEETVRLTCEVAAEHVSQNRTTSDRLANVTLSYEGAGAEGARPGLLGWFFGKLWPF